MTVHVLDSLSVFLMQTYPDVFIFLEFSMLCVGLSREELIGVAMLCGSDYTVGLKGQCTEHYFLLTLDWDTVC